MRSARWLAIAALAVTATSFVATIAWVVSTLPVRPLDGVEGDLLFEADRIRAGLPLYVDPVQGARDYGAPPARYLVLYAPVWSAFLSRLPAGAAAILGRLIASLAWWGTLASIVIRSPRDRRWIVGAAALFVAGVFVLALYGGTARPDAVAVALSVAALDLASREGRTRISGPSGVLFALAAWIKPNIVGAAVGAFLGAALATHGPASARFAAIRRGLLGALGLSAALAGILTAVAGPAWIHHLLASTGQRPSWPLWTEQIADRAPFFALPIALALAHGARGNAWATRVAATGLATSLAWSLVCLAKIGSASNYWLEPAACSVLVLARIPATSIARHPRALAAAALVQAIWTGTASVRGALGRIPVDRENARVLAHVRTACGAEPGSVVLADEPGLELMLNGRIIETPFQSTHLAYRGRFPVSAWKGDLQRHEVGCLVMQDDLLERPLADVRVEHDRFAPELRRVLTDRFELVTQAGTLRLYRPRRHAGFSMAREGVQLPEGPR